MSESAMTDTPYLSFHLRPEFVAAYATKTVPWGFPIGGGNSLAEITYITKYSRRKPDGTKERWHETCERVINGMFSILKDHCGKNRTPWNHMKAQRTAEDAYERMFTFKWLPPGRGLWMMGTEFVAIHGSASLQNCAFLSTEKLGPHNPTKPFVRMMEMSMLGIGVGFDTMGAGKLVIHKPGPEEHTFSFQVPDSREGWCESVELLLRSYMTGRHPVTFDYSLVRPKGEPIRGLGGVASGPAPLRRLHQDLVKFLDSRVGEAITSTDIVDIMNLIGKGVVSGNVRRSAQVAFGDAEDKDFLSLKNWDINPERMGPDGWGNLSNNSAIAEVGGDYGHLVDSIAMNGEPGLFFRDLARSHGRLADPQNDKDYRVMGSNPCVEQSLEDAECCTLVETFPIKHDDLADFLDTLKVAYMYAKAVTLLPTHWPETNEVMQRNRRIGCSVSGIVQFAEAYGWTELRRWLDRGYEEVVSRDEQYSEWLGVRESIKRTSVKPSGTVSIVAGVTPGVHWPVADIYWRRQRFANNDPIVAAAQAAGYHVEPDVMMPDTSVVVSFPTLGPQVRTEAEVSVWEKAHLAVMLQRWWADNQVSATFTFNADEVTQIAPLMRSMDGQLKSMSFASVATTSGYKQLPYERITQDEYDVATAGVQRLDMEALYGVGSVDAEGEKYCNNDTCIIDLSPSI